MLVVCLLNSSAFSWAFNLGLLILLYDVKIFAEENIKSRQLRCATYLCRRALHVPRVRPTFILQMNTTTQDSCVYYMFELIVNSSPSYNATLVKLFKFYAPFRLVKDNTFEILMRSHPAEYRMRSIQQESWKHENFTGQI